MIGENPELLFLQALPLDGSMWAAQMSAFPVITALSEHEVIDFA